MVTRFTFGQIEVDVAWLITVPSGFPLDGAALQPQRTQGETYPKAARWRVHQHLINTFCGYNCSFLERACMYLLLPLFEMALF
jgi:hypothetical protein